MGKAEPLLNKPILKFAVAYSQRLAALHGKSVFYSMTTNGTLFDDEIISIIKRYNFGLMVSLDGPKEIHDAQCPTSDGRNSYDMAVAGIRKLMTRRRMVTVRCTMAHPAPDMMRLIKFFDEFGFTRIVLGRVFNPVYSSSCDFTKEDFHAHERQMLEEVIPWIINEMRNGRKPKYNPFASILERQHCVENCKEITPFKCGACRGSESPAVLRAPIPDGAYSARCPARWGRRLAKGRPIRCCRPFPSAVSAVIRAFNRCLLEKYLSS